MGLSGKRKIALWSAGAFLFIAAGLMASIAWFDAGVNSFDADVSGSVVEEYFHCGTGTQADPYVITRPIHYYHLVEFFQRTTSLPKGEEQFSRFGTDYLYFQVGYDIDEDGDLEVYAYDDLGIYQGNEDNPSYSTSLNMAYYSGGNALLPIGTNEVPFIGNFNGNASDGISIANLNIHCAETIKDAGGNTINRSASDIGVFGYVADQDGGAHRTIIQNANFNSLTIDLSDVSSTVSSSQTSITHTDAHNDIAYVGYIAGHVHSYTNYSATGPTNASPLSNVYVKDATILGGAGVRCNFGYIGLVDTVDSSTPPIVAEEVAALGGGGGTGPGESWGGTMDMVQMFNSMASIESTASYVDQHELHQTKNADGSYSADTDHVRYSNAFKNASNAQSSYCFANKIIPDTDDQAIVFLSGRQDKRRILTDKTQQEKTLYFCNGTTYTTFYGPNFSNAYLLLKGVTASGSFPADGKWHYDGTTPTNWTSGTSYNIGHVWYEANGTKYYLAVTSNQISSYYRICVSTTVTNYTWSFESTSSTSGTQYGATYYLGFLKTTHLNATYQFYATNSMRQGTARTVCRVFFQETSATEIEENTGVNDVMNDTCVAHSTGYIVSGADYSGNVYPNGSGDIRVAKYPASSISSSTVLTYNGSNVNATASMFDTYTETKEKYDAAVSADPSHYYGLHFMSATVGSKTVTAPTTGRLLPNNCVQFNVAHTGSIKFFAGTYFGVGADSADVNDAFFALYKINRSGANISSLTEIKYVHKKAGEPYYYSDSATPPAGYTMAFNSQWITNPSSITTKRIYYFEIPVNPGEYALGSIQGKNGAYLMYLDIGASGGTEESTADQLNRIRETPIFTQIDFQTNSFVTNSCFNVGYVIPTGSTKSNFSFTVSCGTVTKSGDDYVCYELIITNSSGNPLTISCLLMDDNTDPNDSYYYMYAITYNGGTRTEHTGSNTFTGSSGGTSMIALYAEA